MAQVKREKMTKAQWGKLVNSGGIVSEDGKLWYPSESFKKGGEARESWDPGSPIIWKITRIPGISIAR